VKAPFLLESPSGLGVQMNANGSIRRLDHGGAAVSVDALREGLAGGRHRLVVELG
jgi:hypothetical protein